VSWTQRQRLVAQLMLAQVGQPLELGATKQADLVGNIPMSGSAPRVGVLLLCCALTA